MLVDDDKYYVVRVDRDNNVADVGSTHDYVSAYALCDILDDIDDMAHYSAFKGRDARMLRNRARDRYVATCIQAKLSYSDALHFAKFFTGLNERDAMDAYANIKSILDEA